jgi:sugar phosphate isomerase/epimerase
MVGAVFLNSVMILGLSSFAFGWSVGVESNVPARRLSALELVQYTVDAGISSVQFGDNLPLHLVKHHELEDLREVIRQHSLRIEIGARKLTSDNLKQHIDLCAYFKSPLLRFVIDGDDYEPDLPSVAAIIRQHLGDLEHHNITLAIENHDRFKARELASFIQSIDNKNVGICLDCVNSMGAGEGLEHVVDLLAPYTVNLHLKDFIVSRLPHKMGFLITGTPAGTGMMDVDSLVKRIAPFNRCQSAVLEQWVPFDGNLEDAVQMEQEWAKQSLEYLKSLPYFKS